jgi:hypothetical protein
VVIVVDNLMDVDAGDESYQGQLFIMQELRNIAKRTGACVIVLAHTQSEQGSDYGKPQPRNKILNKVDQKPQLIFTLGREDDLFRIAVVKDRNSKATDPTAKRFITIRWHGDTASFSEFDADWHRYRLENRHELSDASEFGGYVLMVSIRPDGLRSATTSGKSIDI